MGLALAAQSAVPVVAAEGEPVSLFKIVTSRDEITVGMTAAELSVLGSRPALDLVAERLAKDGYIIGWQYASGRSTDGSIRQLPLRRVAVYAGNVVRVEPLKTDQIIESPK